MRITQHSGERKIPLILAAGVGHRLAEIENLSTDATLVSIGVALDHMCAAKASSRARRPSPP
jgi:hypothetical protein